MEGSSALSCYKGRRVLVTGHTGFKGSWLTFWLARLGAKVKGIALEPPTQPSLFEAADLAGLVESQILDLREALGVEAAIKAFKPEIVFHLAAQPLVRVSYRAPRETLETNVMGTANLLDAIRVLGETRAVVVVTSDKCYRNNEWLWGYRENEPMGGHDPYSASKGCAELVTASYRDSFFAPGDYGHAHQTAVATARAGNVIGGGDWARDRLVPDCIRSFMAGEPVRIRYPGAMRPWEHVLEPLYGYLLLGAKLFGDGPEWGEGWNFAPLDRGDLWTVGEVVGRLCELWGNGASWRAENGPQPYEAGLLALDATKAFVRLGWKPKWDVATTLEKTVGWYRAWQNGSSVGSVHSLMAGQIDEYMEGHE